MQLTPSVLGRLSNNRSASIVLAESGKGFGTSPHSKAASTTPKKTQKQAVTVTDGDAAVKKAIRLSGGNAAAPVDERQAAEGRIDRAKVKNWGSGKPEELGSLQLESFTAGKAATNQQNTFYVHLTYAVAQAGESGRLNQIMEKDLPVKSRIPLPDFPQWSLKQKRYVQYLVDQQSVHHVLECSIAEALAVDRGAESSSVKDALSCFSEARGLDRSLEIARDLTNMGAASSSGKTPAASDASSPKATAVAESYGAYIGRVGQSAAEGADVEERSAACLRLIAHAYANHMLLLTRGSMVGKTVAQKLNLFDKQAINTYRSYPFDRMGKDPFEALKRNVTEAGTALSDAERQVVVDEVPLAMAHSMQLWEALAHVD